MHYYGPTKVDLTFWGYHFIYGSGIRKLNFQDLFLYLKNNFYRRNVALRLYHQIRYYYKKGTNVPSK